MSSPLAALSAVRVEVEMPPLSKGALCTAYGFNCLFVCVFCVKGVSKDGITRVLTQVLPRVERARAGAARARAPNCNSRARTQTANTHLRSK